MSEPFAVQASVLLLVYTSVTKFSIVIIGENGLLRLFGMYFAFLCLKDVCCFSAVAIISVETLTSVSGL